MGFLNKIILFITIFFFSNTLFAQTADEYYQLASDKYSSEDYEEAMSYVEKVLNIDINYANAYYLKGLIMLQTQDYKSAIIEINKAIKLDPDEETFYFGRATYKEYVQDYLGAKEDYDQVIRINPNYENVYYKKAYALYKLMLYNEAMVEVNNAIKINPNDADSYSMRGLVKFSLKDLRGALSDFLKADSIIPNKIWVLGCIGVTYSALNDCLMANIYFETIIILEPNNSNAYYGKGICECKLGYELNLNEMIERGCINLSKAGELGRVDAYKEIEKYCMIGTR
jgi:tetratricopeptide (TPR) repeat protein